MCSVLSLKDKSFSLVFLEGRDSLRGWKTLASKLREIGVVPKFRKVESSKKVVHLLVDSGGGEAPPKGKSFAEVLSRGKRVLGETVCVQGESDEVLRNSEILKKCLVGRWGDSLDRTRDLGSLKIGLGILGG